MVPGKWGNVEELLAAVVEILGDSRNLFVMANRDPKRPKPNLPPVKVPRPSDLADENRPRPATSAELAQFLGKRGLVRYTPKEASSDG